ncbi:CHASE3 domain-containing protein [Methylocystis echinoides]|uniref:CHASE3 domain-containing protein n=1 Tax=Methylocystis echinoides TaxID=29468 RepID=UPI003419FDAB
MKLPHRQRAALLSVLFAMAIVAFAVAAAMHTEGRKRDASIWVRHTMAVKNCLNSLSALIRRAESGERGFIATQDRRFLELSYETVAPQIEREIDDLRDLVADNSKQLTAIERALPLIHERLELMRSRIQSVVEGRPEEALASLKGGHGLDIMRETTRIFDVMRSEEDRLYQQREQAYLSAAEALEIVFGFLFLAVAASGLFVLLTSERQLIALEAANENLQRAYEEVVKQSSERVKVEAQLRQAQKLEAMGQLTGGIAHDFNNMLAVIVSSLNILRRKLKSVEGDFHMLVDAAEEGADKAARLVRRLLAFSREQPLDPKVLIVNDLVRGMSDILRRTTGSRIELETHLAKGLWETCIDAHELENALLNLAVNARHAMPNGGRLIVTTENATIDESYSAQNPGVEPGEYINLSVADTGEGMTPEVVARAFDPFFTTKPMGKGTGLGLSQVHGFVKQSNGHIKIYSEPGLGTNISILFPRFLGAVGANSHPSGAELPLGKPNEVLLVVDDDPTALKLTALAARELGYTVYEAGGGKAAIGVLKAHPEISLLVTDVVMSDMDGAQLTREAVFRRHDLKVLYMTGFPRAMLLGQNIQVENVLTKPFTLQQFAQALRKVIDNPIKGARS